MTLVELLDQSSSGASDREGLDWPGEFYTFGHLEDRGNRVANLSLERGIRKGDHPLGAGVPRYLRDAASQLKRNPASSFLLDRFVGSPSDALDA